MKWKVGSYWKKGGVTGSYSFEEQDATTFVDWGTDYLKYDYCIMERP